MNKTLLALGLAVITSSTFAYDGQVDGGFTYTDWDNDIIDTDNTFNLKGTLYFDSVQTGNGPLNEAAFLGHNSNAYLGYSYNTMESNEVFGFKAESDIHHLTAGIEYFVDQFYLNGEIGFGQQNAKATEYGQTLYDDDYDVTTYRALVGYLPVSNLLLAAGIDGYQGDNDEDEDNRFAVKAK